MKTVEQAKKDYQNSLIELKQLEDEFDAKPCTKTAKPLAAHRNVVRTLNSEYLQHQVMIKREYDDLLGLVKDLIDTLGFQTSPRIKGYITTIKETY